MTHVRQSAGSVILVDARTGPRAAMEDYALAQLIQALRDCGATIIERPFYRPAGEGATLLVGRFDDPLVRRALQIARIEVHARPEGVFFGAFDSDAGCQAQLAGGTDSRGLMYALLEVASRIADRGLAALETLSPFVEYPQNSVRGVTRFVVNHHDEAWMFDEAFLRWWYARLAGYRFNRAEYVLGFDTAYLAPPYPWFVAVQGFEHLRVKGLSEGQRDANLHALRRMGQLAHEYGLDFCLAPWQQKAWTRYQASLIEHLPQDDDALIEYTERAVQALLDACPEVDVLQLRVNHEAGVVNQDGITTNERYWQRIIDAVASSSNQVELELRAKGLTDWMIRYAQERGLATTVPTKYWCEHFPVPYHISRLRDQELEHIDNLNHSRRYSYADMLRKPRSYELIYRLWNYGTCNVFEWGDPQTARRFSETCGFGDAKGFVITTPLSLKGGMEAIGRGEWSVITDPDYRMSAYEDERYFMWYLCFGRLGYNAACDAAVWRRELRAAYGAQDAPDIECSLAAAGKILPLITTFHMPVHPSLIYWTEMSTGGALFPENNYNNRYDKGYVNARASDEGLFYAVEDYVDDLLAQQVHGRYTPLQAASWLEDLADRVEGSLAAIHRRGTLADTPRSRMTLVDLRMLATLARYHKAKTMAAVRLALWQRTSSAPELVASRVHMQSARDLWQALADLGRVYDDDLCFQLNTPHQNARRHHWRDRLAELDRDLSRLDALCSASPSTGTPLALELAAHAQGLHAMTLDAPGEWAAGRDLTVHLRVSDGFHGDVLLHYRHANLLEGDFIRCPMQRDGNTYRATVPGSYLTSEWDLLLYASARLSAAAVQIVPGLWHPDDTMPYRVIRVAPEKST